ncbi:protein kinase domain-containing protein [Berryella intestinalis]|uniref:protein kinase domain-containing protein n=1 Tax=Berryella intestinalis TaxID=1531429 RepID=UPI000AAA6EEC|nr:serine/threonine-protein kinase [Berryella intestinalis]
MADDALILDRYRPLGQVGAGGFGSVQVAWDPRIQRKVAIKIIPLTEVDARRAQQPDEQSPTHDRWHGVLPWEAIDDVEPRITEFVSPFRARGADPASADGASRIVALSGEGIGRASADTQLTTRFASAVEPATMRMPAVSDEGEGSDASGSFGQDEPGGSSALANIPGIDEARTAARLDDQHIVKVYDVEVVGLDAYLIMEYVEGITLSRLLDEYGDLLTIDMVTAVFDAVSAALSVAHKRGVLHLDIKPDNILINADGQVKVTDFGLATLADASGKGTTGGGTIGYMPLEQMRREHLDARTDEWSLASVTYEMIAADNPFFAPTLAEAEAAIEEAELVLPSLCWDDVDDQIDDVLFYALDPDPSARYDTVSDFAEEMDRFLGDAGRGKRQLSLVVHDALGRPLPGAGEGALDEALDEYGEADGFDGYDEPDGYGWTDGFEEEAPSSGLDRTERQPAAHFARPPMELRKERLPMRARIDDRVISIAGRATAAAGSGAAAYVAAANMPFTSGVSVQGVAVSLIAAVLVAALAAFRPQIGSVVALAGVSVALICGATPLMGVVLLAASLVWWRFEGSRSVAASNAAVFAPIFGGVGLGQLAPLTAGAALRPASAAATALLSVVWAFCLACLGTGSLSGWDAVSFWSFAAIDAAPRALVLGASPALWCEAASWVCAAFLQALVASRGSRALDVVGAVLGGAVLALGLAAAAWFASGGTGFAPSVNALVPLAFSTALTALFLAFVRPNRPAGS